MQMFNCYLHKNVLKNVDINFLLIILYRKIFYAICQNSAARELNMLRL